VLLEPQHSAIVPALEGAYARLRRAMRGNLAVAKENHFWMEQRLDPRVRGDERSEISHAVPLRWG
jgi:hypothetical protein